jgi:hypothetical protein
MVKQSFFQSDTSTNKDTLLRFSQHLDQLDLDQSLSTTIELSDFGYPNQPVLATPMVFDHGREPDAKILEQNCVCLNLETLKCFEIVERQYEDLGVVFNNCIAIKPSNPAFPTSSGSVVLMGAPKGGFLEVTFACPVNTVKALVTSSQRLLLSAYNHEHQIIAQNVLPAGNLANSDSVLHPNTLLSVIANQICSISFCAFDGQFTLDNFSFCF